MLIHREHDFTMAVQVLDGLSIALAADARHLRKAALQADDFDGGRALQKQARDIDAQRAALALARQALLAVGGKAPTGNPR